MIVRFFSTREWSRFPFFFLLLSVTILLGSLGLTGIAVVSDEVNERLSDRARELLTSDFSVGARRDLTAAEKKTLESIMTRYEASSYKVVDIYSMVTHIESGQSRLSELRGVGEGYPFFGAIRTQEGSFSNKAISVSKDLLSLWKITEPGTIRFGTREVKVGSVVLEDPSLGLRGFSLAPRITVPLDELEASGLLRPGATGGYSYHFRLKGLSSEELARLKTEIYQKIPDPAVKVSLPRDSSEQTGRAITMVTNFMSLSALIGLVLSLVGVFYLYQSHLLARLKDLCLLNLHGLTKGRIVAYLVLQFTAIFFVVLVLELLILTPLLRAFVPSLSSLIGISLEGRVTATAVLRQLPFLYGLAISVLVPLLFGLLRTPMGATLKSPRITLARFRVWDFIPFFVLLWGFSWFLSNSLKIGNIFFASLLVVFVLSWILVSGLQWLIGRGLSKETLVAGNLTFGVALRNLARGGHRLTLCFLSLALGTTLISLILQLQGKISQELTMDENRPALFIFDIQEEQLQDFEEFSKERGTPLSFVTPMIRARIEQVNGRKYERPKAQLNLRRSNDDDSENRARNTGLNLTYRAGLSPAEKIVEGEPFPEGGFTGERLPFVSVEKRWAQRMSVSLNDELTFDVQGVELRAKVKNIREVKWTNFTPNFFVSMEPGSLDGAPKTFLAVLASNWTKEKSAFQRDTQLKFPNISFIDVEEIMGKLATLFEKSRLAIEFISYLSLGVGLVILYGLAHDQVYRRTYDLALMKSLGLSSGNLRSLLIMEFGLLFTGAMSLGLFLGWLMAQLIGKEIFKLPFSVDVWAIIIPAVVLVFLCLTTILLSSWRLLHAPPRALLSEG